MELYNFVIFLELLLASYIVVVCLDPWSAHDLKALYSMRCSGPCSKAGPFQLDPFRADVCCGSPGSADPEKDPSRPLRPTVNPKLKKDRWRPVMFSSKDRRLTSLALNNMESQHTTCNSYFWFPHLSTFHLSNSQQGHAQRLTQP